MKRIHAMKLILVMSAALATGAAWAAEAVTSKEAEAMVKKGVAYIKANGKEKGLCGDHEQAESVHGP